MLKKLILLTAIPVLSLPLSGCDDDGNRVVEQPDEQQMQAKKAEFADFQKKMAEQSRLSGQK